MPTLINTLGATDANSYVASVADATALLDSQLVARAAWDAASDDDRIRALITAGRILNTIFIWRGVPSTSTQGMAWPRTSYADRGYVKYGPDVDPYDFPTTYPANLPLMQTLLASHLLERRSNGQDVGGIDTQGAIKRVKAGSVEVEYKDTAVYVSGYSVPMDVIAMADPWAEGVQGHNISEIALRRG